MNTHSHLYRSADNRMIAGVAGGIAEYANVDPTIVRLVFLGLAAAGGAGVVLYVAAWLVMPETKQETIAMNAPEPATTAEQTEEDDGHRHRDRHRHDHPQSQRGRFAGGLILITLGAALLIQQTLGIDVWHYFWPLCIIGAGLLIILRRS